MPDQPRRTPQVLRRPGPHPWYRDPRHHQPERLRRNDNWLTDSPAVGAALGTTADPLVIDLGFGASAVTTVELEHRLRRRNPGVRVLGLEIDQERVAAALRTPVPRPWTSPVAGSSWPAAARSWCGR